MAGSVNPKAFAGSAASAKETLRKTNRLTLDRLSAHFSKRANPQTGQKEDAKEENRFSLMNAR